MFKAQIKAAEAKATAPFDTYDSILERPSGTDPNQNAWLTLQLRIQLKFADSKNQVTNLTVSDRSGKFYARRSSDPLDVMNVMGGGNRLCLLNAVSWQERIALHTGLTANQWAATGIMETPTRKMSAALTATGLAPAVW